MYHNWNFFAFIPRHRNFLFLSVRNFLFLSGFILIRIDLSVGHYSCAPSGHNGDCSSFCVQTMEKEKNNK